MLEIKFPDHSPRGVSRSFETVHVTAEAEERGLHLEALGQRVRHVEEADNRHELAQRLDIETELARDRRMRVDAVRATIRRRN